ncbi:MAG TPA: hypothetical protein DIU37_05535, partial [Opitutae bacterium]|nr:hypothetical protein [Opitutae bacterium]
MKKIQNIARYAFLSLFISGVCASEDTTPPETQASTSPLLAQSQTTGYILQAFDTEGIDKAELVLALMHAGRPTQCGLAPEGHWNEYGLFVVDTTHVYEPKHINDMRRHLILHLVDELNLASQNQEGVASTKTVPLNSPTIYLNGLFGRDLTIIMNPKTQVLYLAYPIDDDYYPEWWAERVVQCLKSSAEMFLTGTYEDLEAEFSQAEDPSIQNIYKIGGPLNDSGLTRDQYCGTYWMSPAHQHFHEKIKAQREEFQERLKNRILDIDQSEDLKYNRKNRFAVFDLSGVIFNPEDTL